MAGKGLILPRGGNHVVFLELRRDSRVTTGISAFPLGWPWEALSSPQVARETCGLRSSHRRVEETSPRRVSGSQRWRSSIQSAKTRPGADCGSDHKLLIAKFRLKLKKIGKTTRPFRYDLNQIPYDSIVEVRNRFKGLDLIEYLINYGQRFMTLYRRQGSRPFLWKRNAKRQNGCLGRPYK